MATGLATKSALPMALNFSSLPKNFSHLSNSLNVLVSTKAEDGSWILLTGFWRDSGRWDDNASWRD